VVEVDSVVAPVHHDTGVYEETDSMEPDAELTAMTTVAVALSGLDEGARERVLTWAASRFNITVGRSAGRSAGSGGSGDAGGSGEPREFAEFVDLFDAANPQTDPQRAAVAGYWFQVIQNNASWQSQTLNSALKDLGHGLSNVTDALDSLQERRPAFVRQVSKSGSSRQARKTYKLTTAGVNFVRGMLGRVPEAGEE
jgi:hypothetical protein